MTELEPPVIGDELLRERVAALESEEIIERNADGQACVTYRVSVENGPYAHWLGGSVPETLAGTAYPGDVHLRLDVSPWGPPDLPLLDLSWSAPDVGAMLDDILDRLGLLEPLRLRSAPDMAMTEDELAEWKARFEEALAADAAVEWPTQELKRIVKEEQ